MYVRDVAFSPLKTILLFEEYLPHCVWIIDIQANALFTESVDGCEYDASRLYLRQIRHRFSQLVRI